MPRVVRSFASSILEVNRASSPEPWTQPNACPTFPAGQRGQEAGTVWLRAPLYPAGPSPALFSEPGWGHQPCVVCAGKCPGGRPGPGVLWKGPEACRKSLGQEVVCSGKCFTFLIFLSERKAMQLDFLWQLFPSQNANWNSGRG